MPKWYIFKLYFWKILRILFFPARNFHFVGDKISRIFFPGLPLLSLAIPLCLWGPLFPGQENAMASLSCFQKVLDSGTFSDSVSPPAWHLGPGVPRAWWGWGVNAMPHLHSRWCLSESLAGVQNWDQRLVGSKTGWGGTPALSCLHLFLPEHGSFVKSALSAYA